MSLRCRRNFSQKTLAIFSKCRFSLLYIYIQFALFVGACNFAGHITAAGARKRSRKIRAEAHGLSFDEGACALVSATSKARNNSYYRFEAPRKPHDATTLAADKHYPNVIARSFIKFHFSVFAAVLQQTSLLFLSISHSFCLSQVRAHQIYM